MIIFYSIINHKITTTRLYNEFAVQMAADPEYANFTNNTQDETYVNDEEAKRVLARSFFLTFTLFFIGAISSPRDMDVPSPSGLRHQRISLAA